MRSLTRGIAVAVATVACGSAVTAQTTAPVAQPILTIASPAPSELVGTWDALSRSYGGMGSSVLLAADGMFALVFGAMVDVKYKVNGRDFTFFGDDHGKEFSETQRLKFVGDTAVLSANGCSMKLIPLATGTAQGSLVGKWRMMHLTGVPAYEEFSPDGVARLRVPIQVQKGTYRVSGDSIAFHAITPRPEDWRAQFFLTGDTLTVLNYVGKQRYLRARQLIPMDVQQPAPPAGLLCQP